jgi:hypothetical protein
MRYHGKDNKPKKALAWIIGALGLNSDPRRERIAQGKVAAIKAGR